MHACAQEVDGASLAPVCDMVLCHIHNDFIVEAVSAAEILI